jgi:hypothetical protein
MLTRCPSIRLAGTAAASVATADVVRRVDPISAGRVEHGRGQALPAGHDDGLGADPVEQRY